MAAGSEDAMAPYPANTTLPAARPPPGRFRGFSSAELCGPASAGKPQEAGSHVEGFSQCGRRAYCPMVEVGDPAQAGDPQRIAGITPLRPKPLVHNKIRLRSTS